MPDRIPVVAVVEDHAPTREALCDALRYAGYRPLGFENGAEALRALAAIGRVDLVVLDLIMPVMGGREFLREVERRGVLRGVPILPMTGTEERLEGRTVVRKPFDVPQFLDLVARLIAEHDEPAAEPAPPGPGISGMLAESQDKAQALRQELQDLLAQLRAEA